MMILSYYVTVKPESNVFLIMVQYALPAGRRNGSTTIRQIQLGIPFAEWNQTKEKQTSLLDIASKHASF